MRIGVGVSTAPDARQAAVQAAGLACDELAGEAPSLAVLLGSPSYTAQAADMVNAVHETVEPPALIGGIAQTIIAGSREMEDESAVAVWLASGLTAETFLMSFAPTDSGGLLAGYRFDPTSRDLHLLLPDPYTFPTDLLIAHLNTELPGKAVVVGGLVNGGRGVGGARLFRDHDVFAAGLVGVRLHGQQGVPIVSQGCRPIGQPYIVTGADGAMISELGGRPALQRLREIVKGLPPIEQALVNRGLHIGIVVDEHQAAPGQGDFLIRGVFGSDPPTGAIQIGEAVEVGATVQFQVRDAVSADKDLRLAVKRAAAGPGRPVGALLFTCNGRGRRTFRSADHDAATIQEILGGIPLAGFFAAGEIGPIAGRNALHAFTASMALFMDGT